MTVWSNGSAPSLVVGTHNDTATLEDSLEVSYKTKHALTIQFGSCTPCYLHKGVENLCLQKKLHTDFIAALFITVKICKQQRCPSVSEQINCGTSRQWNIIQYKKRNKQSSCKKTQRKLKCLLLSERSHYEKATYHMIPTI